MKQQNRQAVIRAMQNADLEAVMAISREAFGTMSWQERDFLYAMDNAYDFPLVLSEEERILGFSLLRLLGPEAEVQEICILPERRGQGLGELLMDHMLDVVRERQGHSIFLEVRAGNRPARGLYEKKGFQEEYVRRDYYSDPREDAVVMRLLVGHEG